ncbi:MAG: cyclophilin-like fold protein [Candidatus Bathyarchaeia archaeon]
MSTRIKIHTASTGYVEAEILEQRNPKTAKAIVDNLPFESSANTWGDEVYFSIPVDLDEEKSQREVEVGDCGYWPAGSCFCIFFGRTPASSGSKPVAASAVNVFGRIVGDATVFRKVRDGEKIRVERA